MPAAHSNALAELKSLPISSYLSEASWRAIECFVFAGPEQQRSYRLCQFFKSIDWLPISDITPNPLKQLPKEDAQRLEHEIQQYLEDKQEKRQSQKAKREAYRLKVFDYFRTYVPAEDKRLLEELRDYELEKIGEDINWRHYFWFTSYKQIDAFIQQTSIQRESTILQFKRDVELRYKNTQRLHEGSYESYYWGGASSASAFESFDDWVNRQASDENFQQRTRNKTTTDIPSKVSSLHKAYQQLRLSPNASLQEVRQQFRRLTLRYHPDLPGGSSEQMKALLAAYNMIKKVYASRASSS